MQLRSVAPRSQAKMQAVRSNVGSLRLASRAMFSPTPAVAGGRNLAVKAAPKADDNNMHLKDIVKKISESSGIVDKDVDMICKTMMEIVQKQVTTGGRVTLTGVHQYKSACSL
jgi:Bacterial DNA-binding protein